MCLIHHQSFISCHYTHIRILSFCAYSLAAHTKYSPKAKTLDQLSELDICVKCSGGDKSPWWTWVDWYEPEDTEILRPNPGRCGFVNCCDDTDLVDAANALLRLANVRTSPRPGGQRDIQNVLEGKGDDLERLQISDGMKKPHMQ